MKETEVTVGKKGDKNTVASEMKKKKKFQNREQSIVSNVSEKLRWGLENISGIWKLNLAKAVNWALKAVLHAGHIGVWGAI